MKKVEYLSALQVPPNQTQIPATKDQATGAKDRGGSVTIINNQTAATSPAITYNNQSAAVGTTNSTLELPKNYTYIVDDNKEIVKAIEELQSSNNIFSDKNLANIIIYCNHTDNFQYQTEVLRWCIKNKPAIIRQLLIVLCTYNSYEKFKDDPYLQQFNLSNTSLYKNYKELGETLKKELGEGLDYRKTAAFRFTFGTYNAYVAFANQNFDLGKEILDSYLKNAPQYLKISSSTPVSNRIAACSYLNAINNLIKPEYQNKMIIHSCEHFLKHSTSAINSMQLLMRNDAYNEALMLCKSFEEMHNITSLEQKQKKDLAEIHFRLGCFIGNEQKDKFSPTSFSLLKKAYENYFKHSVDKRIGGLQKTIYSLARWVDEDYCNEFIKSLPNKKQSILLELCTNNTRNVTTSDLKSISKKDIPEEFHDMLAIITFIANQNACNARIKKGDNVPDNFYDQIVTLLNYKIETKTLIDISVLFERTDVIRKLFENIPSEKIWNDPNLSRQFIFCQFDQLVTDIFSQIEGLKDDQTKSAKHFEAAIANVTEKNHEAAQKHLEKAIESDPTNEEYIEAAMLNSVLIGNQDKAKEYKGVLDKIYSTDSSGLKQEEATDIITVPAAASKNSADLLDDDSYEAIEVYPTPEEIHNQFQLIKAQKLGEASSLKGTKDGWNLPKNINIDIKDTIYLSKYKGLEYWGVIAEKVKTRWKEQKESLETALKKGFVPRSQGQSGVKSLANKVFEIKINANLRVVTSKVYYNDNKKMLLYFDKVVPTHEMVKLFVNSTKGLTFINCGTSRINEEF